MKTALTLTAATALGLSASAAPIVTVSPFNVGGNDFFVFNVDPNGEVIDTINVEFVATSGSFLNTENAPATVLFAPATTSADTDILGLSTVATGLTVVGDEDSSSRFAAAVASLGGTISAPLDVAQVVLNDASVDGGTYSIRFANQGSEVGSAVTGSFGVPVPEPTSMAMLVIGGWFMSRRRRG